MKVLGELTLTLARAFLSFFVCEEKIMSQLLAQLHTFNQIIQTTSKKQVTVLSYSLLTTSALTVSLM